MRRARQVLGRGTLVLNNIPEFDFVLALVETSWMLKSTFCIRSRQGCVVRMSDAPLSGQKRSYSLLAVRWMGKRLQHAADEMDELCTTKFEQLSL